MLKPTLCRRGAGALAFALILVLSGGCHKLSNSAMAPMASVSAADATSDVMEASNNQLLAETIMRKKNDEFKTYLDQRPDFAKKTFAGTTLLFTAGFFANAEAVQILLDHGADVNFTTAQGERPLDRAESSNATEVIALLKKHGAMSGTMHN